MLRRNFRKGSNAQSLVEYATVLSLIVAVLIAMTPMIRRGTQGMIRTVADQIGQQNESDQRIGPQNESDTTFSDGQAYLVESYSATRIDMNKERKEFAGVVNYVTGGDTVATTSNAFLNLGFIHQEQ